MCVCVRVLFFIRFAVAIWHFSLFLLIVWRSYPKAISVIYFDYRIIVAMEAMTQTPPSDRFLLAESLMPINAGTTNSKFKCGYSDSRTAVVLAVNHHVSAKCRMSVCVCGNNSQIKLCVDDDDDDVNGWRTTLI